MIAMRQQFEAMERQKAQDVEQKQEEEFLARKRKRRRNEGQGERVKIDPPHVSSSMHDEITRWGIATTPLFWAGTGEAGAEPVPCPRTGGWWRFPAVMPRPLLTVS